MRRAAGAISGAYTIGGHLLPPMARVPGYSLLSSTAMLGGALGPILCGLLTSFDPRAPLLAGGLIYAGLTAHASVMSKRVAAPVPAAARPAERPT